MVADVPAGPHFTVTGRLSPGPGGRGGLARAGVIRTDRGTIATPAFIPVGTKATVKAVLPEAMTELGAQALLANAYHLYLQPGVDVVESAGGLGAFMNWSGPTFTDSGGFQVMSLGVGFKKVLAMAESGVRSDDVVAAGKERLAHVDDDGVTFKSHLDGSRHRFTPEVSMQVQFALGADIIFAFDECTTLFNTRGYQEDSVERTAVWARRCLSEHGKLRSATPGAPRQFLYGVVQGAQYEDLRRRAAADLAGLDFDGFGIGGALAKAELGRIVAWVNEELPEDKPRHLLGIGEPDDLLAVFVVHDGKGKSGFEGLFAVFVDRDGDGRNTHVTKSLFLFLHLFGRPLGRVGEFVVDIAVQSAKIFEHFAGGLLKPPDACREIATQQNLHVHLVVERAQQVAGRLCEGEAFFFGKVEVREENVG